MPILRSAYQSASVAGNAALLAHGPAIPVFVGLPPVPSSGTAPAPQVQAQQEGALIDTGASASCIDEGLAQRLGLTVIDRRQVGGVAGTQLHNVYLALVVIPALNLQNLGPFIGVNLRGLHKIIVGRDFLVHTVLIYDGLTGSITLCT